MSMKYNMSAGTVTINLPDLAKVLGVAVRNARSEVTRSMAETERWDVPRTTPEEIYHANQHAHYYAEVCAKAAQDYADAWCAYFVVNEAIRRDETILIKQEG